MRISRVVIQNFRSFEHLDVSLSNDTTCVIGENNTGKSNFLHAIRLCIDSDLSSSFRSLIPSDIHSTVDISYPNHVLIGLEITDFIGNTNEMALVGAWQFTSGSARLIYRYRPKPSVREELDAGEINPGDLSRDDYHWEITGGGDSALDLNDITWDRDIGSAIRFSDLQSYLVVYLPALRDVERELRQYRNSPLARLINAIDINLDEKENLVNLLQKANEDIAAASTIEEIAKLIDKSFKKVTGRAYSMDVELGLAEPSFDAIVRALRILLSNFAMQKFEPRLNGLGLNNILYVSILIKYFEKRLEQNKSAGQIILFEEPEAHLHPQLQLTLFKALNDLPFQSILTTHSTHITAKAPLESYVVLSQSSGPAIIATMPVEIAELEDRDIQDLERYLDATKSSLLFARKVILVEGPSEMFLIPALFKHVEEFDLSSYGISIIPIYGTHFAVYAKLFGEYGLPRKCAIVSDGDLKPSDALPNLEEDENFPSPPDPNIPRNEFISVFTCETTFERALVSQGTLQMLALTADDIGAPFVAKQLREGAKNLTEIFLTDEEQNEILNDLSKLVLRTAKRLGKARFAQIASLHAKEATVIPKYIRDALEWLIE